MKEFIIGQKYVLKSSAERVDTTRYDEAHITCAQIAIILKQPFLYCIQEVSYREGKFFQIPVVTLSHGKDAKVGDVYYAAHVEEYQLVFKPDKELLLDIWKLATPEQKIDIEKKFPSVFKLQSPC